MSSRLTSSFVSQDAQDPELGTPSRSLTGPSRRKSESRSQRLSLGKPYARSSLGPSAGKQTFDSPSSVHTVTPNRQTSKRFGNSTTSPSTIRTPQQNANTPSNNNKKGGLLSGLRQAIFSRPLSWLQSGAAQSDSLPTSRSSNSIGTEAENGVAAQRNAQSLSRSNTLAAHEFGASSTSSRPSAFVAPPPSTPSRSPYLGNTVGLSSRSSQFGMTGNNGSTLQDTPKSSTNAHRSPSPARSSASAIIRSHGRQRLSMEPSGASRYGNSSLNVTNTASLLGTPAYRRSGSQRGDGSVASGGSASQAHSSASFAYGFGSERRLGGLTTSASLYGGAGSTSHSPLASTSYSRLPSRSPFAIQQRRSLGGSAAASEMGSLHGRASPGVSRSGQGGLITTPVRPVSMFGGDFPGSRAGSVTHSRASSRGTTPKRREWSSLKLAPPNVRRSEGEELMQEYLAMRDAAMPVSNGMQSIVHPALNDTKMAEDLQTADFNPKSRTTTQNGSLKRGASMSIDGDSIMSDANPRKRQMVWDPELGFVSRQDQIAARPPKPIANNEAERLLNALEGMRTPLGDARRDSAARSTNPSRQVINIPLSVPSSDPSRKNGSGDYAKAVSPYARAMRKQKMQHSNQPAPVGLRSRLRKEVAKANSDAMSVESEDEEVQEDSEDEEPEESDEEEEIEEPPRRRQAGKTVPPQKTQKRAEAPAQMEEEPRTLRSGKVIATQASPPKKASETPQKEKIAPMSRARFSVSNSSVANKQRAERQNPFSSPKADKAPVAPAPLPSKDKFSVKTDDGGSSTDSSENRRSSSLRQGAEKTSRTHVRSGRVGIDNDDDDDAMEDSPSAEELSKIKLPTNLFPQGFSFSSAPSSTSSTASSPQIKPLKEQTTSADTESTSKPEGSSLLSRMGGFAAPEASQSTPSFSLSSPSPPTFSLSSPKGGVQTAAAPSLNKPAFSFQPAISSPLAGGSGSSSQPTSSSASPAPPSNFFTAPSADEKKKKEESATPPAATAEGQKPIPNFFASSLAKSSTPAPEASKSPAFSFGAPSSNANATNDTSKPAFSFGQSAESTPTPKATSPTPFSFGNTASQASSAPAQSGVSTAPTFSFGAPAASKPAETSKPAFSGFGTPKENAPSATFAGFGGSNSTSAASNAPASTPTFTFGTPSTSSAEEAKKKRGQDDEKETEEPQAKRNFTGFGAPAASPAPAASTPSTGMFNFGTPAAASESKEEKKASSPFTFGAPPSQPSSGSNENKPALTFGASSQISSAPSNDTAGFGGFGNTASSTTQAAKPAFSFGAPASNTTPSTSTGSSTFTFGAKTDSNTNQPANNASSGGTFTFGQPASNTGTTSFGQQSSTPFGSQDNSRQQSPAPFTFGGPAAQQNGTNNAGFGGFGQQTPSGPGTNTAFTFGGAGGQTNPAQSQNSAAGGGSNGINFSFSMPMSNATSNVPSFGSGNQMNGATGTPGTPPAFVFGASNATGNQSGPATPTTPGGAGGFNFGAATNPGSSGMGANAMPAAGGGAAGSLFNIGAPSSNAPAGNRPVRGMPSRRKK